MDAIPVPAAAWGAIEAVLGGELQQALIWRDGDLVPHAAGARGTARLLFDASAGEKGQAGATRGEALAAVGATRTLAEWVGAPVVPIPFLRTAVAPDLASLLEGGGRCRPAGAQ